MAGARSIATVSCSRCLSALRALKRAPRADVLAVVCGTEPRRARVPTQRARRGPSRPEVANSTDGHLREKKLGWSKRGRSIVKFARNIVNRLGLNFRSAATEGGECPPSSALPQVEATRCRSDAVSPILGGFAIRARRSPERQSSNGPGRPCRKQPTAVGGKESRTMLVPG